MTRIRSAVLQRIHLADAVAAVEQPIADNVALRADVAALVCPDWRVASLVMDARSGQVIYANTPCLQMLSERSSIQINSGRVAFVTQHHTDRFYATLERMVQSGLESAALIERESVGGDILSIILRNTQGFFREVLNRHLNGRDTGAQFVIVELATSRDQSDWAAMRAFAQSFSLTPLEAEFADLILRGLDSTEIAALKMRAIAEIELVISALLAKTGCQHPTQLVRLVMTLCPPMRRA